MRIAKVKDMARYIRAFFMQFCAKIGTVLHLPLNEERLRKLTENYISSNEKIKQAIGVIQLPVNSKDGIAKTIAAFDKN